MGQLSDARKQQITKALHERGATKPCPRCGNDTFTLVDGYFLQNVQAELETIRFGGQTVPSVAVVCMQCGFISHHALALLGLSPEEEVE